MDKVFFEQLGLPDAKYNLDVESGTHAEQTGRMMIGLERILKREAPDVILVEGDTNTVLSAALVASKLGLPIGHVEAGLRCYCKHMPEEINRVLVDHCSDLLFAPTNNSQENLLNEGISRHKIFVTGNTIVDSIYDSLKMIKGPLANIYEQRKDLAKDYILATVHRQENTDSREKLRGIISGLNMVNEIFGLKIILPVHPRTRNQLKVDNIKTRGVTLIAPLDYFSFLLLENSAKVILTDSGGVQEEACVLGVPCVTLRDNTERPETLKIGANLLAGTNPLEIVEKVGLMLESEANWANPYGDGNAAKRILDLTRKYWEFA